MQKLSPGVNGDPLRLLVLGAHADDIEIGCGGSILTWSRERRAAEVTWVVLSGAGDRQAEARRSAQTFLAGIPNPEIRVEQFRDGFFPYAGERLKELFEVIKGSVAPDIILTHDRDDRHQDHRLVGELTWQTFRDHLILEYEVLKFDGDLRQPNVYVELPGWALDEKVRTIVESFPSQHGRHWFNADTFTGLARIRGVECRSSSGYAEGFRCSKMVIA